jgi:hypothetical protein
VDGTNFIEDLVAHLLSSGSINMELYELLLQSSQFGDEKHG